jgi:nitrite reductase/ring-hydroxylating ferredoxin subunit
MAWHRACAEAEVQEAQHLRVFVENLDLLLSRQSGEVHALSNVCLHRGAPLSGGESAAGVITCPLHFWQFDLKDGHCIQVPSMVLKNYPVKVEEGVVFVELES